MVRSDPNAMFGTRCHVAPHQIGMVSLSLIYFYWLGAMRGEHGAYLTMLTDTKLRNIKPKAKLYKVNDRGGFYVAITPVGSSSSAIIT